ncbi:MarR family winged helix-turn-helix transcriptional regulator [Jonesiaceae bacterium BS-20]|uniref:MarR family winged helix-turn-helix transcriptional regulator n=1 Tax=Jonesiaceae bacterium BS-20 TaxID=3120821 RepID=A0AAU7DU43_9MICO
MAQRRDLAAIPTTNNVNNTVDILNRIDQLRALSDGIMHGVEQFTSLKLSHFQILQALENDVTHPRHIGRRIGLDAKVVTLTLETLEVKGLVYIAERIGERVIEAGLTEAGYAALGQAEAVKFRAMDALLHHSSEAETQQLLHLLNQAVIHAQQIMNTIDSGQMNL